MRRLLLLGLGAAGAVLVAEAVRRGAARSAPGGSVRSPTGRHEATTTAGGRHQAPVPDGGEWTQSALTSALERFRAARAQREHELVAGLLVIPEAGDPGAVFRRRDGERSRQSSFWEDRSPWAEDASGAGPGPRPDRGARPGGPPSRVDPDEPLYDF